MLTAPKEILVTALHPHFPHHPDLATSPAAPKPHGRLTGLRTSPRPRKQRFARAFYSKRFLTARKIKNFF